MNKQPDDAAEQAAEHASHSPSSLSPDDGLPLVAYSVAERTVAIAPAPASRDWMSATRGRFAHRCLPLLIANQSGWLVLNDTPFRARWTGRDEPESLRITHENRSDRRPLSHSHFGHGIITWSVPYLFRTPPGFNLLARGPANLPKDGVCALEGVVETDWTAATFTMNWKITRPFTDIRFDEGEPFCMIVPQRRADLESFRPEIRGLDAIPEDETRFRRFKKSRNEFMAKLRQGGVPAGSWQRDYFRGRDPGSDDAVDVHQTRLHLKHFASGE